MNIKRLVLGTLQANCYLVWESQNEAIIIDPGDDTDFIIQTILEHELVPRAIIATHGHFDHIMAALEIKLIYNIPFYMHKADEFLLERMDSSARHFINFDPGPPPDVDIYLKSNSTLEISNLELEILHTPGHTPGSVCLYSEGCVFVGDLMFADGTCGGTDHAYSNKSELAASVDKIKKLRSSIIYPGHGEEFTLRRRNFRRVTPQTD